VATLKRYLRRYTDIPALIYMLREKQITLLDPETWDDTNDSYFLTLYREKKKLGSVLAVCFTRESETYHHWKVFASGASGVCITFRREELLQAIEKQRGIRTGQVRYLKLDDIRESKAALQTLPFLKRHPFKQESEFRIIYESPTRIPSLDIPISLSCIQRVTLSPWLHPALSEHVNATLRAVIGRADIKLVRSTLIGNADWKTFGESAVNRRKGS
jgi:hypothetical protein